MKKTLTLILLVLFTFNTVFAATDVKNDGTLSTNLITYWEMEEASGTRTDSHGSNDLADSNSPGQDASGIQGNAVDLERSSSQYLSITDASQSGLDFAGDSSFSMWLKVDNAPTGGAAYYVFAKSGVGNGNRGYYAVYYESGGSTRMQVLASSNGTSYAIADGLLALGTGTWHHVVVVIDTGNTDILVYLDGNSTPAISQTSGIGAQWDANGFTFKLGDHSTSVGQYWDGSIDEFGVWDKALTTSEISDLYNSGSAIPYDAGGGGGGDTGEEYTIIFSFNDILFLKTEDVLV